MKSERDKINEDHRRAARSGNGLDLVRRDQGVLFHNTGSTGWGRRRDHGDYKAGRSEHNFADQHDRFTEEQA
jgi:hypothetical protein